MKLTTKIVLELASHEAVVREMYLDSVGVKTWGVGVTSASGHAVEGYKNRPSSLQRCIDVYVWLLETKYLPQVIRAFKGRELEEHELAAALSFHYNTGGIARASWVKKFLKGYEAGARKSFLSWNKPKEIIGRRTKEANLFFKGQWSFDGKITEFPVKPNLHPDFRKGKRVDIRHIVEELLEPKPVQFLGLADLEPAPPVKPKETESMFGINTNLIHNVLNTIIVALPAMLLANGCVTDAAGSLDCAMSWISPQITSIAIMVAAGAKLAINFFRDGLTGMVKPQPPVDQ